MHLDSWARIVEELLHPILRGGNFSLHLCFLLLLNRSSRPLVFFISQLAFFEVKGGYAKHEWRSIDSLL
ncbi:hypothetical protein PRIPAC_96167 [Pristionchus pacificus]|uniref:Ribosomal protein n=1 Tax=Pristionchus pacificus TaxID=54126 RepID=A0A8R1US03_PRIPA|nr:hypothetical protein PRIPAC_96167 [Pristionchus pacificus]|eukprot:PDM63595.1 hypothetical protein PRIPAC_49568 [Pristionchus pacificus]